MMRGERPPPGDTVNFEQAKTGNTKTASFTNRGEKESPPAGKRDRTARRNRAWRARQHRADVARVYPVELEDSIVLEIEAGLTIKRTADRPFDVTQWRRLIGRAIAAIVRAKIKRDASR